MKHTQIKISSLILALCLGFGLSLAHAQMIFGDPPDKVRVNTIQESANKAVYSFKGETQEAKLTLTKSGNVISVAIANQSGSLGMGQVSVENGLISLRAKDLHTGTLGIWAFAASVIAQNGNQTGLTPRQKAAKRCREYCKNKFNPVQPVFLALAAGNGSTGREDPPVCVPMQFAAVNPFENAWKDYFACFNSCMEKAKAAYQNKN